MDIPFTSSSDILPWSCHSIISRGSIKQWISLFLLVQINEGTERGHLNYEIYRIYGNTIYAWTVANFCVLCAILCTWHAPCEPFMVGKLQWGQLAAKLHSHVWQIHVEIQKIHRGWRVCSWHGPCKVSMAWGGLDTQQKLAQSCLSVAHTFESQPRVGLGQDKLFIWKNMVVTVVLALCFLTCLCISVFHLLDVLYVYSVCICLCIFGWC